MPKRSRSTFRKRTRSAKRRKFGRRISRRALRGTRQRLPGASSSQIVRLKYVDRILLDPAIDTPASHVFRANSIFDPDSSGTGHQPMGHDEWNTFYTNYLVIGSKIKATYFPTATSTGMMGGVLLKSDSTLITNVEQLMEQGLTTPRSLAMATGGRPTSVRRGFSPRKFFGVKDLKDNKGAIGASFGNNPSNGAFWHVYLNPMDSTTDIASVEVLIEIEYSVMLTERATLAQS